MEFVDLHVHSTASDGSFTPGELVEMAAEKGLYAIALTDHDTVDGIYEAYYASQNFPVYVIPGVEVSSSYNGKEIHILGYRINTKNEEMLSKLRHVSLLRHERNCEIVRLLNEKGFEMSVEDLYTRFNSHMLTRTNFTIAMIETGFVKSKAEAYEKYLGNGKCCYVPRYKMPYQEAIAMIRRAGGISVLAHPANYKMDRMQCLKMLLNLQKAGLEGIEAIYSTNTPADENRYRGLANELGLFITGGSDFHGQLKPDIELGTGRGNLMIPRSILANLGY